MEAVVAAMDFTMSTEFVVFAVIVVFLLYWIGTNVHAITKRAKLLMTPTRDRSHGVSTGS
jgi:hypothetical protein